MSENLVKILNEIKEECEKASFNFPPFHNSHEGIAVLREEYLELEKEIFTNQFKTPKRLERMREEAIQVGAMAVRIILDICDNPESWENKIQRKIKK